MPRLASQGPLLFQNRLVSVNRRHQFLQIWQFFAQFKAIGALQVNVVPGVLSAVRKGLGCRFSTLILAKGVQFNDENGYRMTFRYQKVRQTFITVVLLCPFADFFPRHPCIGLRTVEDL